MFSLIMIHQFLWCNLNLSVPADEILIGRPFGGVGFVCQKLKHCTINEIPHEDNRLSVIQIVDNKTSNNHRGIFAIF